MEKVEQCKGVGIVAVIKGWSGQAGLTVRVTAEQI